jgi:hypothetical protein
MITETSRLCGAFNQSRCILHPGFLKQVFAVRFYGDAVYKQFFGDFRIGISTGNHPLYLFCSSRYRGRGFSMMLPQGQSSLDINLRLRTDEYSDTPNVLKSQLYYIIFGKFREPNVEIPLPQRGLHFRS